jgi:UDP-N-acetylglucosamine 4,6-dehydratase
MRVLVTGATGFLGRALVERFRSHSRVVAFARSESRLASLSQSYRDSAGFRAILGDVRDRERLVDACRGVDLVVHAAALKRVDDGSYNPQEMIATNIDGTYNVLRAATTAGVGTVIVVSSDKAVEATNVYGATKFCAEQLAIGHNAISAPMGTRVAVVRYGNVIGSTGSVLRVWREQLRAGRPLRLTDPEMTRFFMSVDGAVDLVDRAARTATGGEVFVPSSMRSVRLADLAASMSMRWQVDGHDSQGVEVTGIRAGGEKMAETMLNEDECRRARLLVKGQMIVVPPAAPSWTTDDPYEADPAVHSSLLPYRSDRSPYLVPDGDLSGVFYALTGE